MTTDEKRKALLKAYPGYAWHEKVAGMPSEQVIAVYLRFEQDGWPNTKPKRKQAPKPNPPNDLKPNADDDQLPLF
jgi:hypothetical protein